MDITREPFSSFDPVGENLRLSAYSSPYSSIYDIKPGLENNIDFHNPLDPVREQVFLDYKSGASPKDLILTGDLAELYANSENTAARRFAALIPGDASPQTLEQLSGDPDYVVRVLVAGNRTTPPDALARLAQDDHWETKYMVAQNSHTPGNTLSDLSFFASPYVRFNVAKNPSTPAETLTALAKSNLYLTREAVAHNSATPPEVLSVLAQDKDWSVRKEVAWNPVVSDDLRMRLASEDPDERVRYAATHERPDGYFIGDEHHF
jgi:hypothetical protein